MSSQPARPARVSRSRLRRAARSLVRVGALLAVISLVVTLAGGLATRSMIDHLRENSAELLRGSTTLTLTRGAERTVYVGGGLIAPGDSAPTPVEDISCTITGPNGPVTFDDLASQGRRVGLDNPLVRFQVVGSFRAVAPGEHVVECNGRGVVVAPEVSPAGAIAALGGLSLGSLGTFAGVMLLVLGGVMLLVVRKDDQDDDDLDEPPAEGAEEWWEEGAAAHASTESNDQGEVDADPAPEPSDPPSPTDVDAFGDDYVELTDEELAALSDEEIAELQASGALIFIDDEDVDDEGLDDEGLDDEGLDAEDSGAVDADPGDSGAGESDAGGESKGGPGDVSEDEDAGELPADRH